MQSGHEQPPQTCARLKSTLIILALLGLAGCYQPCANLQDAGPLSEAAQQHMDSYGEVSLTDSMRADGIYFRIGPPAAISKGGRTIRFTGRGFVDYYDGERIVVMSGYHTLDSGLRFIWRGSTTYVYVLSVAGDTIKLDRKAKVCGGQVTEAFLAPDGIVFGVGDDSTYTFLPTAEHDAD